MALVPEDPDGDIAAAYTSDFILSSLPSGAARVLEIGCGHGEVARRLQDAGLEVAAVDAGEDAVAAARARGIDAHLAEWPDFAAGSFDAVLFTRSLHHVRWLPESVSAAFACLRQGGRVIVEDFAYAEAPEPTLGWFESLSKLLAASGYSAPPGSFVADLLARDGPIQERWHSAHDHDLHSAGAIEAALRQEARHVATMGAAYYFRYLAPVLGGSSALLRSLHRQECELIELGLVAPLGRRFVAAHHPI